MPIIWSRRTTPQSTPQSRPAMTSALSETLKKILFRSPSSADGPNGEKRDEGDGRIGEEDTGRFEYPVEEEEDDDFAPPETQRPFPLLATEGDDAVLSQEVEVEASTAATLSRALLDDHSPRHVSDGVPGSDAAAASAQPSPRPYPLPRFVLAELQTDLAEWMCHVCLIQRDPAWLRADESVLQTFLRHSEWPGPLHPDLVSRLLLVSFHAALRTGGAGSGSSEDDDVDDEGWELTAQEWEQLRQDFLRLEQKFCPAAASGGSKPTPEVREIVQLLGVQRSFAALMADLRRILDERPRNVNLQARQALESYQRDLERVWRNRDNVPQDLRICAPDQAPSSSRGIDRVRLRVRQLVSEGPFSLLVLQDKAQAQLLDWASRCLDTPTLVQLGYNGVTPSSAPVLPTAPAAAPPPRRDEDDIMAGDVSSFGADSSSTTSFETVDEPPAPDGPRAAQGTNAPATIRPIPRGMKQPRRPSKESAPSLGNQGKGTEDSEDDDLPFQTQPQPLPRVSEPRNSNNRSRSSVGEDQHKTKKRIISSSRETRFRSTKEVEEHRFIIDSDSEETLDPDGDSTADPKRTLRRASAQGPRAKADNNDNDASAKANVSRAKRGRSAEDLDNEALGSTPNDKRPRHRSPKPVSHKSHKRLSFTDDDEGSDRQDAKPRNGRKRAFFTEDEVDAIREGVARFGKGNWSDIRAWAGPRLANRTAVQIKDKYRTMERTNQV